MLGKNKKNMEWGYMPAVDKAYLRAAYKRYESLMRSKADNFQDWLQKRGIRKQLTI